MKVKFVSQPFLVLSIKNGFYKIKKSIFRPNYSRYEKMLRSKMVHLKETYKFYFNHFLEKRMVFILIKKMLKIKSCGFRPNNARYEKMLTSKIVHLKKICKFCFNHFMIKRTVFVLIVKNVIKKNLLDSLAHSHRALRAQLARISTPRARDLMVVALRVPIYVIVALRAPTYMNFALRAQCCVLDSA